MPRSRLHAFGAQLHTRWHSHAAPWLSARREHLHHRFTEHPQATNETYLQHLAFTLGMGGKLLGTGLIVIVHGLFPFLFTRTASRNMQRIWRIMSHRGMTPPPIDPGSNI